MIVFASCVVACALFFCACTVRDGVDGKNGKDFDIYSVYEAYVSETEALGGEPLSLLDFINEYLDIEYTSSELDEILSIEASINRSLMSAVTVIATFYGDKRGGTVSSVSTGSGVIVDVDRESGDAYIITNAHVVYNENLVGKYSTRVHVALYGQEDYIETYVQNGEIIIDGGIETEIVAGVPSYDLALLRVTGSEDIKNSSAVAADFVESDYTTVGERVYAIGNPGGYGMSVSEGIVSKDSEYIGIYFDSGENLALYYRVLRTDAALNSGNSGGGLFNADGKIVGLVNSKAGDDDYEGISYALPAGTVRRVVKSMIDAAEESSGMTEGISKLVLDVEIDADFVSSYIDDDGAARRKEAVYVKGVVQSGIGKSRFGFKEGDLIEHLTITSQSGEVREDLDIDRLYLISDALISARMGDEVTFTVKRGGVETTLPTYVVSSMYTASEWEKLAGSLGFDILFYI
ncbi:MAG: S1C family serine protease [Clostridia bacterium]|nr:S1C family serine protease [Clostridia bacterium]